jgi:hypothetical protein
MWLVWVPVQKTGKNAYDYRSQISVYCDVWMLLLLLLLLLLILFDIAQNNAIINTADKCSNISDTILIETQDKSAPHLAAYTQVILSLQISGEDKIIL